MLALQHGGPKLHLGTPSKLDLHDMQPMCLYQYANVGAITGIGSIAFCSVLPHNTTEQTDVV